jgi:RAQPRD family integrative conjugative element protein
MNIYPFRPFRQALPLTLGLLFTAGAYAQESTEQIELTAMVRQIDWMQHIAAQKASPRSDTRSRYHFDYQRLNADLIRMRAGIKDYLAPERAQPRDPDPDPLELDGRYRQNNPDPNRNPKP